MVMYGTIEKCITYRLLMVKRKFEDNIKMDLRDRWLAILETG